MLTLMAYYGADISSAANAAVVALVFSHVVIGALAKVPTAVVITAVVDVNVVIGAIVAVVPAVVVLIDDDGDC